MIAYFDTSALVKLYVRENGSEAFADLGRDSEQRVAHEVAYVEVRAALAAIRRARVATQSGFRRLVAAFEADWSERWDKVGVDGALIQRAGDLAEPCALSAFDSVHLAAAEAVFKVVKRDFMFAVFDTDLRKAAASIGLPVFPDQAAYEVLARGQ